MTHSPYRQSAASYRRRIAAIKSAVQRIEKKIDCPWFERISGRERLQRDLDSIAGEYPNFRVVTDRRFLALEGAMIVHLPKSDAYRSVRIRVVFPPDYPKSGPASLDVDKVFKTHPGRTLSDRHVSVDGWCCLWLVSPWNRDDPHALLDYFRQLLIFVHRQLIYDATKGRWVGPQWQHGDAGVVQYIRESLGDAPHLVSLLENVLCDDTAKLPSRVSPCPCGSGRRYEHCHRKTVKSVLENLPSHFVEVVKSGRVSLT